MTLVTIPTGKLNKFLIDIEILIEDMASILNQDEIAIKRLAEIQENPSIGISEQELDKYARKRGIKIE